MSKSYVATKLNKSHLTIAEKSRKLEVEESLKGKPLSNIPPRSLNKNQRKIYKWLYDNLAPIEILGNIDLYTLINACIIIDRLRIIDAEIDTQAAKQGLTTPYSKQLHDTRKQYFNQYMTICKELCLSPSSRIIISKTQPKEEDPLLKAIGNSI